MILTPQAGRASAAGRGAFTLLEVALATFITVGMLLVVLFFYRQAERLRQDILLETERITAIRQVMNQLTTELESLKVHDPLHYGLMGGTNYLEFVTATPPSALNWQQDELDRVLQPRSDLLLVAYELAGPGDPSEATGLARSSGPVPEFVPIDAEEEELAQATTSVERELLSEHVRHLRFRYWDGTAWLSSWTSLKPPLAVEITLGGPPMPPPEQLPEPGTAPASAGADTSSYPYEQFQRVVALAWKTTPAQPGDGEGETSTNATTTTEAALTPSVP